MQSYRARHSIYIQKFKQVKAILDGSQNHLERHLTVGGHFLVQSDLVPDTPKIFFFFDILMENSYLIDQLKPLNTRFL